MDYAMKALLSWISIAFLLAFLFSFACGDDDDDDDAGDADDDTTDDDTIDDDTVDDDDDPFWPPPPLNLDPYQDDGQRLGILCREKVFLLTGDVWQETEHEHFGHCFALDENTFFLNKNNSGDVYRLENGVLEQIGHLWNKDKSYYELDVFTFFARDLGYFSKYEYTGDQWLELPIFSYDMREPDDAVAVENDYCLAHWNGSETETIVCLDDHPVYEQFSPDILPLYIAGIQYNALDDIWVAMSNGGYSPLVFTHWDGATWDKTQIVYEGDLGDFEVGLDWDFTDAQHGWAVVYRQEHTGEGWVTVSSLYKYTAGVWTEIEKPQPPLPENYSEYGYQGANDRCGKMSVVNENELWTICVRCYYKNNSVYQYYLLQMVGEDAYFWPGDPSGNNRLPANIDMKLIE